jgi:glutathione S-transferase
VSPFSAKVRIVCTEKALSYELREIPWSRATLWGPKPPELFAVSPRGEIPALIDEGIPIRDSTVIIEYLEERYPRPALMPRDPMERAQCRLLEEEADRAMSSDVSTLIREVFRKPDGASRDVAAVRDATANLEELYKLLDERLENRSYLCGAFTIADAPAFLVTGYAGLMGVPVPPERAHLGAWFQRMRARPSVAKEFDAMLAAAARA